MKREGDNYGSTHCECLYSLLPSSQSAFLLPNEKTSNERERGLRWSYSVWFGRNQTVNKIVFFLDFFSSLPTPLASRFIVSKKDAFVLRMANQQPQAFPSFIHIHINIHYIEYIYVCHYDRKRRASFCPFSFYHTPFSRIIPFSDFYPDTNKQQTLPKKM